MKLRTFYSSALAAAVTLMGFAFAEIAQAQPANDNRANAIAISGTTYVTGDNSGATRESGDPVEVDVTEGGTSPTGNPSVWWRWTPTQTTNVTIATARVGGLRSQFDTQLGVYTESGGTLTEIVSNEDNSELGGDGRSKVTFNAQAGTSYLIMVNGWNNTTGPIHLYIEQASEVVNPTTYNLTINTVGQGTTSPGTGPQSQNSVVNVTATPANGWAFASWTGPFGTATQPTVQVQMTNNITLTATFIQTGTTTFNVNVSTSGSGTVTVNPATGPYMAGQQITLTASAAQGGAFTGWSGAVTSSDNPLIVTVNENMNLVANFTSVVNTNSFTIFWQNQNGQLAAWRAGLGGFGGAQVWNTPAPGRGWQVAASADTDNDTRWELLWQNPAGQLAIWELTAEGVLHLTNAFQVNAPLAPPPWKPIAYTHLNNDSHADILWHNEVTGHLAVWHLSNTVNSATFVSAQLLGTPAVSTDWKVADVARINDDSSLDILWQQKSTGRLAVWFMNGTALSEARLLNTVAAGTGWDAVDIDDLNGDGAKDILWRSKTTGDLAIWLLGPNLTLTQVTPQNAFILPGGVRAPLNWKVMGLRPR